ncbi:MAG: Helix-turn-helix domain [Bacteroidetes bacterium]|nr:Helix-turn-helix domain [Bacteroidota bacterium]
MKKTDLKAKFGNKIKNLRQSKNITQADLAGKIDVDIRTIRRIETGTYNPTLEVIISLSIALNTSIPDLFK